MNTDKLNKLTEKIIGYAYKVHNTLGCGFLEKVYENALVYELKKQSIRIEQQKPIQVNYDGAIVGDYMADIMVDSALILELKAVKNIDEIHVAQVLNYLKATELRLGLILNFGKPKMQIKRLVNNL